MRNLALSVEFEDFLPTGEMTRNVEIALQRAINLATTKTRTNAARAVREQVRFPASYLSPSQGRLKVTKRAKRGDFEGIIEGSDRPTSLARFARSRKIVPPSKRAREGKVPEVEVNVQPEGSWKKIKRAFLIRLNNNNIGLAVRTDGAKPKGSWKPKSIGKNVWLLYSASVDQVLMSGSRDNGVYGELEPEVLDIVETEFNRQLALLEKTDA